MIASRNRPRTSEYPWPFRTGQLTVADVDDAWDSRGPGLLGPLPMHAMMELLFRVSEIEYDISGTDLGPVSHVGNGTLIDADDNALSEIDVFREWRQQSIDGRTDMDFRPGYEEFVSEGNMQFMPLWSVDSFSFLRPSTWPDTPIFRDSDGGFHLSAYGDFAATGGIAAGSVAAAFLDDGTNLPNRFLASLILSSGTYQVNCRGSRSDTALTITATKWHSYAGKYDVDTGNLA